MPNLFNELDELQAQFDSASEGPESKFVDSLKQKLHMKTANKAKTIFGLQPRIAFGIMGFALVTLTVFSLAGLLALSYFSKLNTPKTEQEILQEIASANSRTTGANRQATTMAAADTASSMMLKRYLPENTYIYSRTTTTHGPKIGECEGMAEQEGVTESHSYYSNDHDDSKYASYDLNGNLKTMAITTKEYNLSYQGGKFAIKTLDNNQMQLLKTAVDDTREAAVDMPTSSTPAPSTSISDYFGGEAKIVGEETLNGQSYYVISTTSPYFCKEGNPERTLVTKSWASKDGFKIAKTEQYLNDAKPENLVVTQAYETEEKKEDYSAVAAKFNFDVNTEVKTLDMNALNARVQADYSKKIEAAVKSAGFNLIYPAAVYKLQSASAEGVSGDMRIVTNEQRKFYTRDFWPATAQGQKDYDDYKRYTLDAGNQTGAAEDKSANKLLLSLNYGLGANQERMLIANVYRKPADMAKFTEMFAPASSIKQKQTKKINLGGQEVEVTEIVYSLYQVQTNPEISARPDVSMSDCKSLDCNAGIVRIFTIGGFTYTISEDVTLNAGKFNVGEVKAATPGSAEYNSLIREITSVK
jgi:hypothetical protein